MIMLNRNLAKKPGIKKGEAFFDLPCLYGIEAHQPLGNAAITEVLGGCAVARDAIRHCRNGDTVEGIRQLLAEGIHLHKGTLPIALHRHFHVVRVGKPSVGRLIVEYLAGHGRDPKSLVVDHDEHSYTLQFAARGVVEVVTLIDSVKRDDDLQGGGVVRLAESNATDGHLAVRDLNFLIVHCHGGRCAARDYPLVNGDSFPREDVARRHAAVCICAVTDCKDARQSAAKVADDGHLLTAHLLALRVGVGDVGHVHARELLTAANVTDEVTEFAAGAANDEIVFHGNCILRVKRFILLYIDTRAHRNSRL